LEPIAPRSGSWGVAGVAALESLAGRAVFFADFVAGLFLAALRGVAELPPDAPEASGRDSEEEYCVTHSSMVGQVVPRAARPVSMPR
jgi:hypothetical protein